MHMSGPQSGTHSHGCASRGGALTYTTKFSGSTQPLSTTRTCIVTGCCAYQDGTDAEARRRRARLLGLADGEGEGGEDDEAVIAGTDRLQRLDFSWRPEDEVDVEAAAAAVAAEQAARQKRQQLQRLTKQATESQQVGGVNVDGPQGPQVAGWMGGLAGMEHWQLAAAAAALVGG
jgi:hypothetical protein